MNDLCIILVMTLLAAIRRRRAPWTRRVLGLFAVSWLAMALQPCAMALGMDAGHDCPHCPPAHSAHAGHGDMHGAPAPTSCAGGASGCDSFAEYNYDGRLLELKPEDAPVDVPMAVLPPGGDVIAASVVARTVARSIHPPGVPPPVSIRFCVFLN